MLDLSSHCRFGQHLRVFKAREDILVKANSKIQYITSTGQKTGKSKIENQLQKKLMTIALVAECQNLNSGSRLMKGRNSWSCFVGRLLSPSSNPSS